MKPYAKDAVRQAQLEVLNLEAISFSYDHRRNEGHIKKANR